LKLIAIAALVDHQQTPAAGAGSVQALTLGSGMPIAVKGAKTGKKMWALAARSSCHVWPGVLPGARRIFLGEPVITRHMVGTPWR
jgi:hypothetical protein